MSHYSTLKSIVNKQTAHLYSITVPRLHLIRLSENLYILASSTGTTLSEKSNQCKSVSKMLSLGIAERELFKLCSLVSFSVTDFHGLSSSWDFCLKAAVHGFRKDYVFVKRQKEEYKAELVMTER